jgi:hypothetical protein
MMKACKTNDVTESHMGQIPAYKSKCAAVCRAKMLRTFDTCHWPLRAVGTPRLFKAFARPRKLVTPERRIDSMIGSTVRANRSASSIDIFRPLAAASAVLVGFPSLTPVVLREARAAWYAQRSVAVLSRPARRKGEA